MTADVIKLAQPREDDGFGDIHGALMDEIESLHCVEVVMRYHHTRLGQEVEAAYGLLIRTVKRIDAVHTKFDEWDVRRKRRPVPPEAT